MRDVDWRMRGLTIGADGVWTIDCRAWDVPSGEGMNFRLAGHDEILACDGWGDWLTIRAHVTTARDLFPLDAHGNVSVYYPKQECDRCCDSD